MIYTAFTLVAILVLTLGYQFMVKPSLRTGVSELFLGTSDAKFSLVYVYMNGCGWCARFSPTWDAFTVKYQGSLSSSGVTLIKVESTTTGAVAYKVTGYPAVMLVDGKGKQIRHEGDRTEAGLLKFLSDNGISVGGRGVEGFFAERMNSTPAYLSDAGAGAGKTGPSKEQRASMASGAGSVAGQPKG